MEQFSLEKYLANPSRKLVTRAGNSVKILCTNRRGTNYPVIALVEFDWGEEPIGYTKDGKYRIGDKTDGDLFFAPEKHEGWVNVYFHDHLRKYCGGIIYTSKEVAEKNKDIPCRRYVTTIKIEWEEGE